jgi:predicted metal-dependent hydrolase
MVENKTLEIDGVKILFRLSKRSKRINISVSPFYGVRVAVPYSSSFEKAEEFVHAQIDWIKKHTEKMSWYNEKYCSDSNNTENADIDKVKAKRLLTGRLKKLAVKHGFIYNRVSIRNQRTRWGSCSSRNNISLNIKLVRLPDEMIDYIVLHELVHTIHKDHGPNFWAEMDKLVGNGRQMRFRLKNYGGVLHL